MMKTGDSTDDHPSGQMTTFLLPITTLLDLLGVWRVAGRLLCQLALAKGTNKAEQWAELHLIEGTMTACTIWQRDQPLFKGQQALRHLTTLGALSWQLHKREGSPELEKTISSQAAGGFGGRPSAARVGELVARRLAQPVLMTHLSRREQNVFRLVDGRKTVSDLARLLSLDPLTVAQILQTLYHMHLITFEQAQ